MRRGLRPRSPCSGNCLAAASFNIAAKTACCTRRARTTSTRFLREIAGAEISLKDFRTLLASVAVLDALACAAPATSKRARRRQVLDAIRHAADDLGNTPAICAKSYVHETVVNAFEDGVLEQFAERLRSSRSNSRTEKVLAQIAAQVKADAAA